MSARDELKEAIAIFVDERVDRELQYPEFEAVMDGFVPMPDFAGKTVKAVYLLINRDFKLKACVFFKVDFDVNGMITAKWNVPLQQLATSAAKGPDLGAGPIALACYSQCSIPVQQGSLWDPVMEPGRNSFVLLKKSTAANKLGLVFPDIEDDSRLVNASVNDRELKDKLEREYAREMRTRLAHTLKEQRLRINTIKSQAALKLDGLKREHQDRLGKYQAEIRNLQESNLALQSQVDSLHKDLELKDTKVQGIREYFEHKLSSTKMDGGAQLEALEQGYSQELELRIAEVSEELQQQLDMKDMELFYRQQQEEALREELDKLRGEHEELVEHGATKILDPLTKAGISFVAYQPGLGQITLPPEEVANFVSSPLEFAADKCGVPIENYRLWLDHFQSPYCNAKDQDGEECGVGVKRVPEPTDFHDGETNRCDAHRSIGGGLVAGRG
ncbi:hypothetical protein QWI17_06850 [Gilvimarinus sp. SDUM040013]|uniref:Uncharacterized protein n=1 Tax=Gilvimarinus gilvus TaxID=3058038 RepID=A0ABU4S295_9GAMM|nr:hypothetical protein [Gilvimarinus sp. SDUM040013]MDO3385552.1 hypothetical protein [Gilvimarinus sp. SDUM040013]MDX6851197.1 hypothetical protein [Gilvimarinus sp. SDUM040013]